MNLTHEELATALLKLLYLVEECGTSPKHTDASILTGEILLAVQGNPHATERIRKLLAINLV